MQEMVQLQDYSWKWFYFLLFKSYVSEDYRHITQQAQHSLSCLSGLW